MNRFFSLVVASLLTLPGLAGAQYPGWQHSGSLFALTTPDGANLAAAATLENFPLLVRLHKDWFDFSHAQSQGEDLRFTTSAGLPLAYQSDE